MKKRNWCERLGQGILCLVLFWIFSLSASAASFGKLGEFEEDLYLSYSGYQGGNWTSPDSLYYYEEGGDLCAVNVDEGNLKVLTFDSDGSLKNVRNISLPLPKFGGYYHGSDGNHYVAVGQNNPQELEDLVVCKILKFNSSWNLIGTADIPGGISNSFQGIYEIFSCSQARMTLAGQYLICHTGRTMFVHDDGLHHQSDITFVVDTRTMKLAENYSQPYSSHSFAQFVQTDGERVYFLNHGDAYPRAVELEIFTNYMTEHALEKDVTLFSLMGDIGDNYTGTTVNGFELGSQGHLVTGISVPHGNAVGGVTGFEGLKKNLYLIVVSPDGSSTKFRWLTEYTDQDDITVREPRLLKVSDDRFVILFQEERNGYPVLRYLLVDSAGNILAKRNYLGLGWEARTTPIYDSGKIMWLAKGENGFWHWEYIPYLEQSGSGIETLGKNYYFSSEQNSAALPEISYNPDEGEEISFQISDETSFQISNGKLFFSGETSAAAELTFSNGSESVTIPCMGVIMEKVVLREGETQNCVPEILSGEKLTFSVKNPAVASISKEGIVTGLSQGITVGTVKIGEASLDFRIYVRKEQNQEISDEGEISSNYVTEKDYSGGVYTGMTIGSTYRVSYDLSNSNIKERYQQNGSFILYLDEDWLLNEEYRNYHLEGETDFAEFGLADGQYTIWIMATLKDQPGRYQGIRTVTLRWKHGVVSLVDTVDLSDSRVMISQVPDMEYTGEQLEPGVTVTYQGKTLVEGRDYQLYYYNNVRPGEAEIYISGKGSFTGYRSVYFQILAQDEEEETEGSGGDTSGGQDSGGTGGEISGGIGQGDDGQGDDGQGGSGQGDNGQGDSAPEDGTSGENNPGNLPSDENQNGGENSGDISSGGNGQDGGSQNGESSISVDFRKRQVQSFRSYKSSATAVYLKWSRVPEAQRYVISGRVYGRGKYVTVKTLTRGTAVSTKITRLKKGAAIKSGTAYQFRITAQKKINGKWVSSKTASLTVRTSPKVPVITGVSSGKRTLKVRWRKVSGADGYQIYLSQRSRSGFKRAATLKRGSTVSKTLKRLKSGKRYYVKIRSFKKVRGKTVYSSFSKVKRIRVK